MPKYGFKAVPKPKLTIGEKWADGFLVSFPVSYEYNGLIEVDNKLYRGFRVPKPFVPKGFKLVNIGIGLQLNARPPVATRYLKKREVTKRELKKLLDI